MGVAKRSMGGATWMHYAFISLIALVFAIFKKNPILLASWGVGELGLVNPNKIPLASPLEHDIHVITDCYTNI